MNRNKVQGQLLKPARLPSEISLPHFLAVVLPQVSRELHKWEQRLTAGADWPLLQQALASLSRKRFHAQGGSFYALYSSNPAHSKNLVSLIVALQTISDYLDNLCDRCGIYDEAAFRFLHRAMTSSLCRGPTGREEYYRFYPYKNDGGYLGALVAECRACTGALPAYHVLEPEILKLASLYNDLQVYKHLKPAVRRSRLRRWFKVKAAPSSPPLHWWEFAAACGSTLAIFALLGLAASSETSLPQAQALVKAYFPWVCGLHILLDYWIDQEEDLREGDFNFVSCYPSADTAAERLHLFLRKSLQETAKLPRASFHHSVIQGLLAVYLSDPKVKIQGLQRYSGSLLSAGGVRAKFYYRICLLLRSIGVL